MSESVVDAVRAHLIATYGTEPSTATVTFLGVEPIQVLRFIGASAATGDLRGASAATGDLRGASAATGDLRGASAATGDSYTAGEVVTYVSGGCARYPMGDPGAVLADPVHGPRAEVLIAVRGGAGVASGVHRTVAVLAAAPVVEGIVLAPDALIDLSEPLWHNTSFTAVLLEPADVADLELSAPAGAEPVQFLRAVPITATEAAWVRIKGAAALRDAWAEAGIDTLDPHRLAAQL